MEFLLLASGIGQQVAEYGEGSFRKRFVIPAASEMQQFAVTDGDTVHVIGDAAGTRLIGFNTPEKFTPQCENERQPGERASLRLKELVSKGVARLTKVACACVPGTEVLKRAITAALAERCGSMVRMSETS
ncbi:thermonuclease family protein [Rhizobium johnstonii]|uniref:thermonuclease family protein n=1 Tax=Rhizobium johnstonii TaxID=3019933 RepID=UPI003F9DF6E8